MSKSSNTGGIGFCGALFLLFLGLRLTDHIDWAWYWIAAPIWIPLVLALACLAVFFLFFKEAKSESYWVDKR